MSVLLALAYPVRDYREVAPIAGKYGQIDQPKRTDF
jgi:hypothetical protein